MRATNSRQIPTESAYVAHLWEYPELTLAIFGMQIHSDEAAVMYFESGIEEQARESLAQEPGLLCVREFSEGNGGLQFQYWRSYKDLADYSKRLPHMAWWRWLLAHDGKGFSFYHEIYQCKTAEAIFEKGTIAVGPGTFCTTSAVEFGGNRSQERQRRFLEAAASAEG